MHAILRNLKKSYHFSFFFQYFSDIAQNPETNQRPPSSTFVHSSGYLPAASATSGGHFSRENSPYSEFVNNGPTRIAMPYRVPDPVLPPWVTSTASMTSSTEHVYAMPARVIRSSEESVERDPRSVGSLVSLNTHWKGPSLAGHDMSK